MLGGTIDHAIGFTIFQNKVCVCNRGYGGEDDAVEIFELPQELGLEHLVETVSEIYDSIELFKEAIAKLKLKKISGYRQKDQKSGNCTWASAKAAVGALCRLLTGDEEGWIDYKQFTAHCREASVEEYLAVSKSPNQELLSSIFLKVKNKNNQQLAEKMLTVALTGKKEKKRIREER